MSVKKLFHAVKTANLKYAMIENGDRVAVGVSGGKDSLVLLYTMDLLKRYTPLRFEVIPISIDLGWGKDWNHVAQYCEALGLQHHLVNTNIGKVVFEERKEKNPCALCANLRSGTLNRKAVQLNCNKVALAHHLDDAVTTLIMSMIFEGQYRNFKPKTYLDRMHVTLIRPLIYVEEKTIRNLAANMKLPVLLNPCPASASTNRDRIKSWLEQLDRQYPGSKKRMLKSMENVNPSSFWSTEHLF